MANPQFTNAAKIPINEKPRCSFAQYKDIYLDTLDIFNTLRLILREFVEDAPADGKTYGRKDQSWVEVTGGGGGGIPEAPVDGNAYARKDAGWVVVPTAITISWGNITGSIASQTDLANALNAKEPTITAGTVTQYWRGDKTWQTLATVATSGSYNDLIDKPTIPSAQVNSDWNATSGVAQILNKPSVRIQLTAARTYYVRPDGNDSNTGLVNNAGGAFKTIQRAAEIVIPLDFGGYVVTVKVADGTYTDSALFTKTLNGRVIIVGNVSNPSNVVISTTASCITAFGNGTDVTVSNCQLQSSSVSALVGSNGASITGTDNLYGACGFSHVAALVRGQVVITGTAQIIGNAPSFANLDNGYLDTTLVAFTLTGSRSFAAAFIYAGSLSYARMVLPTFTGSATGSRFTTAGNSMINVNGAGDNFLPGNAAGTRTSGGEYA